MSRSQFSEIMEIVNQTTGKMTYKKYERVYNKYMKQVEDESCKYIKDAFRMFDKYMNKFELKEYKNYAPKQYNE